ncbi:MAG: cell division protein FtsL [bacterium]|nr:cell division protein FtsL [bacterium]
MKKNSFIALFIATHIVFIVLQIHKHTLLIKESFRKQKKEKTKTTLEQQEQNLVHELYALRNQNNIKKFAEQKLNMKPVRLNQIKTLRNNDKSI